MERVIIIGGNGSGKTTMAAQLAKITQLPLCHLDTLYWLDNWRVREREDFLALLKSELEKPKWILDGNMKRTLELRLNYCDTVIYLDFPGIVCFFGVIKRVLKYHGRSRPDMGDNCIERFDKRSLKFIFSTLKFNKLNRDYFYEVVSAHKNVDLIVLKNRRQVKKFLEELRERNRED